MSEGSPRRHSQEAFTEEAVQIIHYSVVFLQRVFKPLANQILDNPASIENCKYRVPPTRLAFGETCQGRSRDYPTACFPVASRRTRTHLSRLPVAITIVLSTSTRS